MGLWGTGGQKNSNMVMWHIKSMGMTSRTESSNIFIKGQTGDLLVSSKCHLSLTCQFKRFVYQTLCVFSQIKDRKHIEQYFHSVAREMPQDGTWGCWGRQKL